MIPLTRERIVDKIWSIIVYNTRYCRFYPFFYRSYWHYLFHKHYDGGQDGGLETLFYTARPNPGAGIGHQMANWIAGFWWAKQFGLKFAHIPFVKKEWDDFLGFGVGEMPIYELKKKGYKVRKLPFFMEDCKYEVDLQKNIISSYAGQKVVFMAEQDQNYHDQYGVMEDIQKKFYAAPSRENDDFIYDKGHFNIAIHVRRGDIMINPDSSVFNMRYISNDYFYNVLYY